MCVILKFNHMNKKALHPEWALAYKRKGTELRLLNGKYYLYCAANMNLIDIIVTRNKSDFRLSAIEVYTPDELIKK